MSDGVSKRMGNLSPEKQALLVLQMKKKKAAEAAAARAVAAGMPRRLDPSSPAPLSFAQQRLWLLDRLEPGTTAYNIPAQARLRGRLDILALELAIDGILRRHDALRTTFSEQGSQPVQVIAPAESFRLPVADLVGLPEELRRAEELRLLAASGLPFDLERGPLFRAALVRLAAGEHLLLLDMHHIVSDGWSFGVFFRELTALYESFHEGRVSSLPELPVQYPDFAVWQRGWLQGAALDEQLAYWRERLAEAPAELELPLDRVRPAVQAHRGGSVQADLPSGLVARLRELALHEGASPFMTFLAAFQLLLSRLSGQDDVVVGSPSAGRSRSDIEGLIGMFLNTLVLRTSLSGNPTFRELLGRVKEVVLGAYRYQAIPFERLLEELQPERQLSRTPIFQVLFNFVSLSNLQMSLSGVEVDLIESAEAESKFDFTLYVNELPDSLRFDLVYNADLFEPERMAQMLHQLEHLLAQAAADPDRRIGEMSLVTTAAASLLPDPAQPLGGEWRGAIHQALSRTAAEHPDRVAVEDVQRSVWTYAELESRANQLARFLISQGVKKGDAVAVWAHRSVPLVQALMGTLKAGAAFMILDPAYPVPRLLDYLRIGRPTAWIAVPGAPPPPVEVEEAASALCRVELDALSRLPETDPDISIGPDDAACLTFTSGSTGMPKGVVGRHGPLTYFYPWMAERFGLSEDDRFGMLSALSHDPLQRDVFTPVWLGACMVLPDPDRIGAPGYLAGWLRSERVTVLHLTPAMMGMVLDSTDKGPDLISDLPDLRRAFVVGDLLKKGDVEHLQEIAPSAVCVNLYGSTETQRSVSYFEVPRHPGLDRLGKEVLPLGRGMEGCQLLVLNQGGSLAGVGESGEIYLRSRHLALGYLGDEALTAERFRPNPLLASPEAGDRVYRTGDLGRYLPDGGVEFAGRADFQVKLRGFRIELGEVEAALARYPGVRECVVIAREDRPGDRRLVGYLVGSIAPGGAAPGQHDLRAFLGSRLPAYMVPAAFVVLAALPLTRTGKVDRRALPPPAEEQHEADRIVEKSPVEELLTGIWADLLGVSDVALTQSFFELGGHSLLATRMISQVRAVLGVELPLRSVFEEPTLSGFAALTERVRLGNAEGALVPPLVRVPRGGSLPSSFAQQRLWFLDQLEPGSFSYNLAGAVRLEGPLDVAALAGALSSIVQRHESLRTCFVEESGEPRQVITGPAQLPLPVIDLSGLTADTREEVARREAGAAARRPYDLARGPLVRFAMLRLGEQEHALLVGMHHIVSDGWSMGIFVRELGALYGGEAALPELPVQYADYASWQRQWLNGDVMADRLAWWIGQLTGAPQVVDLPLDRPRPAIPSYRGGRASLTIGRDLEARLETMARSLGVTPFMALLSAFAALLLRYGSQSDLVIGTPIANRGRAELEDLIGFFANTLALRVNLSGNPAFGDLAQRVREVALGAYAHQDIPFERLVSELQPERDLSHSPVFQVMLALQNLPQAQLDLAGLTLSPMELDFGRTQYDLSLFLFPYEGGLLARLEYARDLFDPGTMERLLSHMHNLLAGIAEAPERRLADLPLLPPEERRELLAKGNRTQAEVPELLLHQLFEVMARERPGAVAVSFEGEILTYAELNASANRLAHHLRRFGVGPESLVAVCLERSPDLLIALLGVLKAGGAYVPLDPTYPADRMAWVLEDSRASVFLTALDQFDLSKESASDPEPLGNPENLAYVIYTSGSTGRPKGVAVRQCGAVNFLASMARRPGLGAGDILLAVTTIAFDISVLELFLPLSVGARIELASKETSVDGFRLKAKIVDSGATVMQATPATWRLLLEAGWEGSPGLKVLCGGEALPLDLARELLACTRELWNVYGPTETTVWSAVHAVPAADASGSRPIPLGEAIANTELYLLGRFEEALEPVPPGAPGDLYIGGEGLARGYLGRPDLSAERFVPDPLSGRPGARLYRTGDLVRSRQDGAVEFLGRVDHQVKIRGFRIELGEIEAVLAGHPAVRECAVVVWEDAPGDKRLVAYLAFHAESDLEGVRIALREKLPQYMVPAAFVVLPALPLTPNGKVDRRALPSPGEERHETEQSERSPAEELLAIIWSALLRVPTVESRDNFFDLGGHSLLATQVVSRVREVFRVELPLRALFETPTLAGLAERIEQARLESFGIQAPPIQALPRDGAVRASFAQERLWFLDRFGTDRASYNIPAAVRLQGRLNVRALSACLTEIARRHESLRTTFTVTGGAVPHVLQVIAPPSDLPLLVADLAGLPEPAREAEAARLAHEEARRALDLKTGPLLRATLARLGEREHTLFLSVHHIVADGWSIGVLVRELSALYSAFVQGHLSPLPDLPVQYADFAAWQRSWLQGEVLEAQLGWWRERLAGAPAVIELPADRPRPAMQSARGGRMGYVLPPELSQGLQALVRTEGATLFMVLLAGFQALLARTTGREDLPVGTPIANRNRAEIEGLIGFFVNTLVLRGDLAGDPSFRELLARSREVALGAYAHQDVPFEKLVEDLRPERDLSHSPLFQAMVILQNAPMESLELPELTVLPLSIDGGTAKFDLRLSLMQTPEGLAGNLVYNRDLFDPSTVARLGSYLETLLTAAVAYPELPLSELPLLCEAERRQLLQWGNARPVTEGRACLHSLFEVQAASERTAVTCAGEHLTYRELDIRANRLAHTLIASGVRPGDLVGLRLERSIDMVVAVLAVLKAGGAYLPLDPAYPEERLAFAIEDSQVAVVVTQDWLDRAEIECQSSEAPEVEVTPDFPAYVIYTSGSTGRPKGVVVTHANASRLFAATDAWFDFGPDDVWTLFHSYAFDFSVWELWGALLYGGRLVVVPYWVSRSPEAFYELVRDERVTVLNQTPSAFRQLLWAEESILTSLGQTEPDLALRYVVFGGEALELASLGPWYERHVEDRPRLVNMYGITETTVHVTYRALSRKDVDEARGSVIGVPISDLSLRVLDRDLRLQPIGVPGEIHVGGKGLALGYLGRPELTAERFVPDPFGPAGARLYKSGDLARYLADGDVEYLGRIDHQVKIRGFRIELGEIETALTSQPEIREAVVLTREDKPGEKRLVAYLVADRELTSGELRDRLKEKLPEYMVPAAFLTLPALPLTANGKVDRKALPVPEAASGTQRRERVAPRTGLERFLAELWQTALDSPGEVGIEDDFFELGGNSISGAILINRMQETLNEIVHVVVIFDAPTVGRMAAYLIENHPDAVARVWGEESLGGVAVGRERTGRVDAIRVEQMRALVRPLPPLAHTELKNPPAVFVLAPPRSGTTLMRVMLGGHPHLFAPPELELLSYNTLAERRATYSGRDAFWLEGLVRAVMEVRGCTSEEATEIIGRWEDEGWTARRVYGQLQEWLGERILVDKTPSYALDPAILRRAEEDFEKPLYVHLVRHPYGMIRSFEEAKLDQIFFRQEHPFERRELAELIWLVSQENILRFLEGVPSRRWHRVHFEELLREPEAVLRRLCAFLGLDFDPAMVRPYEDKARRMTDGIHAESRMLGDVKFHTYSGIDASTAERWREAYQEDFLGVPTARMANALGYPGFGDLPAGGGAAIPRRAWKADELRPLSLAQERLWFLDQLEPGSTAYNLAGAMRLAGSLDIAALTGALDGIVRRHESLRTTLAEKDGVGWQLIAESAPLNLPLVDLSALSTLAGEEARRVAVAEARRTYDLIRGPLARFTLLRLGELEHVVLIGMHHIVSDGWSLNIFVRELDALYRFLTTGEPAALPELPIQYSDFAAWQRQWLTDQVLGERLAWWTEKLSGAPPVVELPLDRPRLPVQSHRGAHEVVTFGQGLGVRLEALSRRLGLTPFMTLMAGFASLLSRYGGQTDIVVGTPIANRAHAEVEDLIGFFANTLALRVDLSGEPTFHELTGRVRDMALGAYAHQDVPFERLVSELRLERSLSHTPLFQAVLALQNIPQSDLTMVGLTLSPLEIETGRSQFDLSFFLFPLPDGGIRVRVEYVRDLFDAGTVRRLLDHFNRLLEGVFAQGGEDTRISDLPLLGQEEREQVLHHWNDTATRYPREATIHGLFEQQARRTPAALAVVGGGEEVTYSELDHRAERLAARLLAAGVRPDEAVGLCAERSADLIAALLGILKAGGAYVPLDPTYPRERLAAMLSDAGARFVVVQEGLEDALPENGTVRLPLRSARTEEVPVRPAAYPEQLAYILFTSGSTGRPKGVAVSHRNVVRLVRETDFARFGPDEVFLQFAPVSFDASTLEIWGPLLNGGRLVLFPPGPPDLRQLGDVLERHGVTMLWLTAGLFHQMVESHVERLRSVRQLAAGGDVLSPVHVHRALASLPGLTLINGYGPTEGTTFTCCHVMRSEADLGSGPVPIGRPIANTQVYLLDAMFQPVPLGVVGQLYAAGDGLARGYAGRPDLTAERFVPDPVSGEEGTRLYATGDLARWRPSGEIEFLGRADSQVKIRGFRIEPGEIEAVLAEHPEVETPLVIVREDVTGDKQLVAYVVPVSGSSPEPAALRAWMEEWLPSYMVPSVFVLLSELPLGATGKVDRRALPALVHERSEHERQGDRSVVEELLAGIWCDLLGISGVASHESFFELGGHSLLATRMISRIRAVLDLELPLRAVFEEPTLAGLAALAEQSRRGDVGSSMPPLVRVPRNGPLPTSFSQQRLWFLDRLEPGSIAYNLPGAVRLEGSLDVAALAGALSGIVSRHESLRTTFVERDGDPWQVIAKPAPVPLSILDLTGLPFAVREEEVRLISAADARRAYDLAHGPLLRSTLLRLGEREHVLLVGMHHIVSDGWSMGIFVHELRDLYGSLASGEPAGLPELSIQYADYAAWQREWLRGDVMAERLAWWKSRLAGAPQVLDLPLDRPRPPVQSHRGSSAYLTIGRDLEARLDALTRRLGVTPFMFLLAGFATLLRRYGSQHDIVVGTPIANRGRAELEDLIGMFVNTLALRIDLSGDPGFDELSGRVREAALGAYNYQDVPFERLVDELRPERSLSHSPVFQVMLALQNLPDAGLELAGLTLSPVKADLGGTQFDLSLIVNPQLAGGLMARLQYASDLFDPATAERILAHLHLLLEGMVADPETPVSRLPLLTERERAQLSVWDQPEHRGHPEGLLHGLFETQARRTPEAVALVAGNTVLTYAELDEQSARLAARLRSLGAGPEIGVGVCLERKAELVVSLLGVLRAGSFYVPLDPRYPAERLRFLLEDSGSQLVVTQSRLKELLPTDTRCLLLDGPAVLEVSAEAAEVAPENLAYLIYTSGSTGKPKAVAIEHRSAAVLAHWAREVFSPEELRGVLASTAVTFDLSVFELFVTLSWGGTVVLAENALELPKVVARLPAGVEVTLVNTVPSAMAELLRDDALPASVRTINLAGEALPRWLADRAYARPETGRVCNLYGPSEDTTYSTWTVVERSTQRSPTIGRPIHDTLAFVLDQQQQRLPVGVPGELYLAGAGLARGYLGRPELTADRFLPDPFSAEPGSRMYRTGDLVKLGPDGQLDYLGRLDHQVKVRGFRIELGEVEAALVRQPGVESAVVLVREDAPGDKRLVAYLVAPGGEQSAAALRHALQQDLPEPMIPSAFVFVEAFPLTPHGKVDRRSLPSPEISRSETVPDFVPPRTPLEEEVARVWKEVLGVERISVNDSFWDLGGHSLLATRVLSRIEASFEVDLPLQVLFASPTLSAFAAAVGEGALATELEEDLDAALAELGNLSEDEIRALIEQESRELEETT